MAKAVFHIGLEKTGTTSIQKFLQTNRQSLLEQSRVWVPDYLGPGSQWLLAVLGYEPGRSDDLTAGLGESQAREAALNEIRQKLAYSATHQPADTLCFSSEHLSSRLNKVAEVARLRDCFDGFVDDFEIIVYLRDPLQMAISRQSTFVKQGLGGFSLPAPDCLGPVFDFRAVIERWDAVFPGKVRVCLYEDTSCAFDLLNDFCSLLSLSIPSDGLRRSAAMNASLSWDALRLMSRINQLARRDGGSPLPRAALHQLVRVLEGYGEKTMRPAPAYLPSDAEREAYRSFFAQQVDWIFSSYFPERECAWFSVGALQGGAPVQPSMELSASEEMLCGVIVSLAQTQALAIPWAEVAGHLERLSWKIENDQVLNQYDQKASSQLASSIRDVMD